MGDERNVMDATRKKLSIRQLLEQPAVETPPRPAAPARKVVEEPEPPKTERLELVGGTEFFDPDNADYKACGWAGNKGQASLRVIRRDGSENGLLYADLDTAYPGGSEFTPMAPGRKGNVITLRFAGRAAPFLVIIEGLRLRRVWELIMTQRTPWIHELPTDVGFTGPEEPVIRSITFKPILAEAADGGR
jgi:hypothetical protein